MKFLIFYFKSLSFRGWINWIIVLVLVFAVFRACKAEREYQDLISVRSAPVPKTEVSIEAEELGRMADTAGVEKVIYLLSEPIIQEIENHTKVDSFARLANINSENLKSANTINAQLRAENKDLKRAIEELEDGSKDTLFRYKDSHLSMDGVFKNDTIFRIRNLVADASVNRVDYTHRTKWFFGRNEDRATIWFDSKYVRINGMNNITVRSKEPFFDYGISVQSRYQNIDRSLYIGPKGSIKLGRFDITGGYHWRVGDVPDVGWWVGGQYRVR